jgi:hypothetical protein
MNRDQALQHFKLGAHATQDEINEALEQQLFEQKNDVSAKYMVPTLLIKKLTSLRHAAEYATLLTGEGIVVPYTHELEGPFHVQSVFIEAYEKEVSKLKLYTSQASSFTNLINATEEWIDLQETYMNLFKEQFNEYSEALPEEANSREIINTGALLKGLKSGELDATIIYSIERELARISKLHNIP